MNFLAEKKEVQGKSELERAEGDEPISDLYISSRRLYICNLSIYILLLYPVSHLAGESVCQLAEEAQIRNDSRPLSTSLSLVGMDGKEYSRNTKPNLKSFAIFS
jgi:hypothetical protein